MWWSTNSRSVSRSIEQRDDDKVEGVGAEEEVAGVGDADGVHAEVETEANAGANEEEKDVDAEEGEVATAGEADEEEQGVAAGEEAEERSSAVQKASAKKICISCAISSIRWDLSMTFFSSMRSSFPSGVHFMSCFAKSWLRKNLQCMPCLDTFFGRRAFMMPWFL